MSDRSVSWAAYLVLILSFVFGSACAQQGETGTELPHGEAGARVSSEEGLAITRAARTALSEQAKVERSFARFLEGLRSSRVEGLPWDEASWEQVDDLYQAYHDRAIAVSELLASESEKAEPGVGKSREAWDGARQELAVLRERRLELSRAVAQHVLGLDPVRTGELLSESHILDIIGTGREGMFPPYTEGTPSKRQARISAQMRELDPQARDEISFGQFLDELWRSANSREFVAAWDAVIALKSDYTATSQTSPGLLWAYIQPQGKLESPPKMQEILDICTRNLRELHGQRFIVSHAILKEVFGITDPELLHEVATGEAPKR